MSSDGYAVWRRGLALSALAAAAGLVQAQQAAQSGDPAKPAISDAERAKRDADKVFQWIKFHAEKGEARKAADTKPVEKAADKPVAKPKPRSEPEPEARAVASKPAEPTVAAAPPPASPSQGGGATAATAALSTAAAPAVLPQPTPAGSVQPAPAGGPAVAAANPAPAQVALAAPKAAPPSPPPAPVDDELHLLRKVDPEYPRQALANQRSGAVQVSFTVQPDGSVRDVSAARGPDRRLTQAAVVAVQQWRFAPISRPRQVSVEFGFQVE